jgi:hypothetical protein
MNFLVVLLVTAFGINILGAVVKMNLSAFCGWVAAMFLLFTNSII